LEVFFDSIAMEEHPNKDSITNVRAKC
jgi:hypothetical protein